MFTDSIPQLLVKLFFKTMTERSFFTIKIAIEFINFQIL